MHIAADILGCHRFKKAFAVNAQHLRPYPQYVEMARRVRLRNFLLDKKLWYFRESLIIFVDNLPAPCRKHLQLVQLA